jgi:ribose transport system permease protein
MTSSRALELLKRGSVLIAFAAVCVFFAVRAPSFATGGNVEQILSQGAVLALVAVAMTTVVRAGGIDLSVGVSLDIGALVAVSLLEDGYITTVAIIAGLLAGAGLGALNALLIVRAGINPFLATLSLMFIGQSVQRVYTSGGEPIYLRPSAVPESFETIGRGEIAGLPVQVVLAAVVLLIFYVLLERARGGRELTATGAAPRAARVAGLRVGRITAMAYILSGTVCALAGIVLASGLSSYIPLSGNYYLLDAIGCVFIGAVLHPQARPNVPGTLLGVLFFGVLANGLNLLGVGFYWQGFARGVLLLVVLGLGLVAHRQGKLRLPIGRRPQATAVGT